MSIKITVLAKIDGDQLERVFALDGLKNASLAVVYRIAYHGAEAECATEADLMAFLETMRKPAP